MKLSLHYSKNINTNTIRLQFTCEVGVVADRWSTDEPIHIQIQTININIYIFWFMS